MLTILDRDWMRDLVDGWLGLSIRRSAALLIRTDSFGNLLLQQRTRIKNLPLKHETFSGYILFVYHYNNSTEIEKDKPARQHHPSAHKFL